MVYRFIDKYKETFGVRWLIRHFGISSNAYYNYRKQRKAEYYKRKEHVYKEIVQLYKLSGGIIGYRSMKIFLARKGIVLSANTIHKYMNKDLKLKATTARNTPYNSNEYRYKIFPNLVAQQFNIREKNKVWCTDFTYIRLANGHMRYNCTIIDLYDRSVVASCNSKQINTLLALQTLRQALQNEHPANGLILHSDRGCQFSSFDFSFYCYCHGIVQSMSRAGYPYDNAPMERFYNTFKNELIYRNTFTNEALFDQKVKEYIFIWYNQIRPHSHNSGLTPYEARYNLHNAPFCDKLSHE